MLYRWKDFPMGSWITLKLVSDQLPRRRALSFQSLAKEPLSSSFVSSFRHQNIDHIPILIYCSPQVESLPSHRDENLIDMPDIPQSALFLAELSSALRFELQTPEADSFVRDNDATLRQQIFDITEAEHESMAEPD
jgi:hypothetical protein